ncbi:MAG: hypothetical protein E6I60_08130 [Chloroflexi bacterium]|nr:MAG: hypothetical protein E6I60_08130 [Chloroflexota bacterium]
MFGTDWPGPRNLPFPSELSSSAPFELLLALISKAIGGEAAGKLLLLAILFGAAFTSYSAAPATSFIPKAAAAAIYSVNPFVFGRLHYGQWFLLAGYAVLPWCLARIRKVLEQPHSINAVWAALSLALVGALAIHLTLVGLLIWASLFLSYFVCAGAGRMAYLRRQLPSLAVAAVCLFAATAYWTIPILAGSGSEASVISSTSAGDLAAYSAIPDPQLGLVTNLLGLYGFWAEATGRFTSMKSFVPGWPAILAGSGSEASVISNTSAADLAAYSAIPDPQLGLVPNLLGLYGFWAEATGRFTSMKSFVPIWPAFLAVILVGCGVGIVAAVRQNKGLRPLAIGLALAALAALVLEMGVSSPVTAPIVSWLDSHLTIYRGMRDAGKWAAMLALIYSQLASMGAEAMATRLRVLKRPRLPTEWVAAVLSAVVLAVPLYYGNGLLFGMHGEIKPSSYPSGWYAADAALSSDPRPGRTLFLPWHEYMSYSFVRNQNSVVAPPAPMFFSVPILRSMNPEVPGVEGPVTRDQATVDGLVAAGANAQWAPDLASLGVKYVLLAHELDWGSFKYLDSQTSMVKVRDFGPITMYRNLLVP